MSYTNLTNALTKPAEHYIFENLVRDATFLKKHVLARGAYLLLAPTSFITTAVDTIIGLGAGIGAICTLGKHQFTLKVTFNHISGSNKLFVRPYAKFLEAINPNARFSGDKNNQPLIVRQSNLKKMMINSMATSFYKSDNFLKRHVASRLTYVLLAVSCLVTKAVEGIIGIPAACLSILIGGEFEHINYLAYKTLQTPGIINDLFYCTIKFINPSTGII